jgi:hypothetical protein
VDPLVDATGQPYAYTGDDPVNEVDPSGESGISAGTICGEDGPKSAACRGAIQISAEVGKEVADNQVSGCVPTIDLAGKIGSVLAGVRHAGAAVGDDLATHPLATASLVVGTALLFIPVADVGGAELDPAAASDLGLDLGPSSASSATRTLLGVSLVGADTESCVDTHSLADCSSASVGILAVENPALEAVAIPIEVVTAIVDLAK